MKDIKEMTDEEILALTDEDVQKMIKYEAAKHGIALKTKPGDPKYMTLDPPNDVYYRIPILFGYIFGSRDEAEAVSNALKNSRSLFKAEKKWGKCDHYYVISQPVGVCDSSECSIEQTKAYSPAEYDTVIRIIDGNRKIKDDFNERMSIYEEYLDNIKDISDSIEGHVAGVKARFNEFEKLSYIFAIEYFPLSDNNEEVAMNFMDKAYSLTEESKTFILSNYKKYMTE